MANPGATNTAMRLDDDDQRILRELAKKLKMTKSEVIRRSLRKVAREVGILPPEQASVL